MKLIIAFLKLVRWPNLAIIAATQLLFYFSLVQPLFSKGIYTHFSSKHLALLIILTVLTAAAGNIINDYLLFFSFITLEIGDFFPHLETF